MCPNGGCSENGRWLNNIIPGRKDDGKIQNTQCPDNEELMNKCRIKRCTDQHLLVKCDTSHLYYNLSVLIHR